jgi:hypothetical protein
MRPQLARRRLGRRLRTHAQVREVFSIASRSRVAAMIVDSPSSTASRCGMNASGDIAMRVASWCQTVLSYSTNAADLPVPAPVRAL